MKKVTKLLTALVFCSLIIVVACKKDEPDGPTPEDEQGALLEGAWTFSSAELDTQNRPEWAGFAITFSYSGDGKGTYSVSGVPSNEGASDVFKGGQAWAFGDDVNTIVRADEVPMTITVTETDLSISLKVTDASARIAGFNGQWEFTFTR